jgi:acetyltransferase-like isoleucine patch superfamily enzyme
MFKYLLKFLFRNKGVKPNTLDNLINSNKVSIGKKSIVQKLKVNIRKGKENKTFLSIGNDSVINGDFIFENDNGIISVGDRTFIGGGKFICINSIEIGNDVLISWGCTIMDNNAHSLKWNERKNDVSDWKRGIEENQVGKFKDWKSVISSPIIIKDKSWIGFDVVILKGVTIGEGAIVGSKSVVTKNVPDWTIVAGNPAKVIRTIPEDER